jgi:hypothetical protein|eukprot:COSAG06_NODE_2518_length_6729_cov_819.078733_4_plen_96_part_00
MHVGRSRYDVAFTSYHAQDGRALLEMSAAAGATASTTRVDAMRQVRNDNTRRFLIRNLNLPRQARDKDEMENSKLTKTVAFCFVARGCDRGSAPS